MYFYDHAGSLLFEQICQQPEYYLTRTETAILTEHAAGVVIEDRLTPRKARIRLMLSRGLQVPYVPFGREFIVPALC